MDLLLQSGCCACNQEIGGLYLRGLDLCACPLLFPLPPQTSGFLDAIKPPHVVLVHGEVTEMGRLKTALIDGAAAIGVPRNVYMPRNNQAVMVGQRRGGG